MSSLRPVGFALILGLIGCARNCHASHLDLRAEDTDAPEIVFREALVVGRVGSSGRQPTHVDAIEVRTVAGDWTAPAAGEEVTLRGGSNRAWEKATAGEDGWFRHRAMRGGYASIVVESATERVMILDAAGHRMVYVNGTPRGGDLYATEKVRLPVHLREGKNEFLFQCGRGRLRAKLVAAEKPVQLDLRDPTLPDVIVGEKGALWGAVVLINAAPEPAAGLALAAQCAGGERTVTPLPSVGRLSTRKVGFRIAPTTQSEVGQCEVELQVVHSGDEAGEPLDTAHLTLEVRRPDRSHRRTFLSAIDGSVQYYAVQPARPVHDDGRAPALFLSLHGAGVEAIGQANAYSSKTWGHLVAATNRRPYGFDWEDWGRLDAMEVLDLAQQRLGTDPRRTYLTGHSMGGHGVWHLGATFPSRFAAIGPSAGWISFWSYAGGRRISDPTPMEQMLQRATSPSDTLALARNFGQHGVYILHGGSDNNVPARQARTMNEQLSAFHHDFVYHEQPGAGHWWDASDEPGTDCVDWAPLFDFFARHTIPDNQSVRHVEFATANPAVSSTSYWAGVEAQVEALKVASIDLRYDPGRRRFAGTTNNVARLTLDLDHAGPGAPLTLNLDGQRLEEVPWPADGGARLWLSRSDGQWTVTDRPSPAFKGPHRYGPFKEAFRNRVVFVHGTQGDSEENAWAFAKARYDAESIWYRGNASIDVIADQDFDPNTEPDRNVILYGNAQTNAAWSAVLEDGPVRLGGGSVRIGGQELTGDDLACLFVQPRRASARALVGVIGGTGVRGMRLTDRMAYFVSGVAYPDAIVLGPETLHTGTAGVRVAGFFGVDWSVETGEFVWAP